MFNFNPLLNEFPEYKPSYSKDLKNMINLSKNENPFDLPQEIKNIFFKKIQETNLNRYPELTSDTIRQKIADFFNYYFRNYEITLDKNNIVIGNGSDELISYTIKIFNGDHVIVCPPTFEMYEFYSTLNNAGVKKVPLNNNFEISEVEKKVDENTRLVFICSPNNPTGNLQPEEEILKVLKTGVPVVIDEAYADFSKTSMIKYLEEYPNLIILKTFSKAFGLAGVRAGALIANQSIVNQIMKIKSPYSFNVLSEKMVETIIENYDYVRKNIDYIIHERELLSQELKAYTMKSDSNFLLLDLSKIKDITADSVYEFFLQNNIIVRKYKGILENKIRVTIGTKEENQRFLECFKKMINHVFWKTT